MKQFSEYLAKEMHQQLETLQLQTDNTLQFSEKAICVMISIMQQLRTFLSKYKFQDKAEEIQFFKEIKPQFSSRLVYYNEIYNIESCRPFGTCKEIRKYYSSELDKLNVFFNRNKEFYNYYLKGNTFLDEQYFLRGKYDIKLTLDSFFFQADHRFSTSYDYKVATILANDLIRTYLEKEFAFLGEQAESTNFLSSGTGKLKWTGSKVGIIELVYALHTEGVFNYGSCDLKEIATFFGKAFEIDLGQFHRTFSEIIGRKSERTKFLNRLMESLVRRMEDYDAK